MNDFLYLDSRGYIFLPDQNVDLMTEYKYILMKAFMTSLNIEIKVSGILIPNCILTMIISKMPNTFVRKIKVTSF